MKAIAIDRAEATVPWFAARDAHMRSEVSKHSYTTKQRAKADAIKFALELCYSCKDIYLTYRQRFVAIKVEAVNRIDKKNLAMLEASWVSDSSVIVEKVITAQGIIYRVKFV